MIAAATPLDVVLGFLRLLRISGLRVGLSEAHDALNALEAVKHPQWGEAALKATLVKRKHDEAVFDRVFELYFSQALQPKTAKSDAADATASGRLLQAGPGQHGERGQGGGGGGGSSSDERDPYQSALNKAVQFLMRHVYNPARQNQARSVQEAMVLLSEMVQRQAETERPLESIQRDIERAWLASLEANATTPALEALLGPAQLDEIEFAHMDQSESTLIEQEIERLIDSLLAKPKRRYKRQHRGHIDVRKTMRRALQFGGTPAKLAFRHRHVEPPQLYVLADISNSVEVFFRFFLMLTRAFQHTVSECRTFVFSDQLHEVTDTLNQALAVTHPAKAVEQLLKRLRLAGWTTRRTDYGTTFQQFYTLTEPTLNRRATVVVLGDARNNQAPPQIACVEALSNHIGKLIWLNPEREALWDSGDSIQSLYAPYCDKVLTCRNLAQLRRVVRLLTVL